MNIFLEVCKIIGFQVALDKTFWGTTSLVFLELLLDSQRQLICIPKDKLEKANIQIDYVLNKNKKKITVHQLQKLCRFLNFLCRAIVPGRAFVRWLYVPIKPEIY